MKTPDQLTEAAKLARSAPVTAAILCPVCDTVHSKKRYNHMFCCESCKLSYWANGGKNVNPSKKSGNGHEIKRFRDIADRIATRFVNEMHVSNYDFMIEVAENYSSATKILESEQQHEKFSEIAKHFGFSV